MPQASDEQRARWNGPSDEQATRYLKARGYTLDEGWCWTHTTPGWEPSPTDQDAATYLMDEWDMGPIVGPHDDR